MSSKNDGDKLKTSGGRLELRKEWVYTAAEVADLLRPISLRVIRAAIKRGELGASKIAGRFVILGSDLISYIRRHRVYRRD